MIERERRIHQSALDKAEDDARRKREREQKRILRTKML